jgi:hypothetical protein
MKRLLLPLIAALALPTAVSAESYWLVISDKENSRTSTALEKIEMESLAQCEKQGYIWASTKNELISNPQSKGFTAMGAWKCLIGK